MIDILLIVNRIKAWREYFLAKQTSKARQFFSQLSGALLMHKSLDSPFHIL